MWALVIGFFMILVDTTIVSVANPAIKAALDPTTGNLDKVVWVTSAYLLAYAVPLLVTGRLGDRFGPKNIYLIGLAVFTLASLGCGLSPTLGSLIAFRALQGIGASLMTPQTMAVITRTFPADRRGAAMGLWGATSGVAMLVGPLAGGLLVDAFGWEWIFFVNLPVGVIGFVLAWILVPKLQTHPHRFDMVGVFLSATALFLIVFALQEAEQYDWGVIWGPVTVWMLLLAGILVLGLFIWQQARTRSEPLVPMALFRDRNFTVAGIGITTVGFMAASMSLPFMFFLQLARGLTPTESALVLVPMAVAAGILSPLAGRLLDRTDPRFLLVPGMIAVSAALIWYAVLMNLDTPMWMFLLPSALMGAGQAGLWGPLATTATRNLDPRQAGAGSGVYNTMRTMGSVLGSAAIAAVMQGRLEANLPGMADAAGSGAGSGAALPPEVAAGFATAMAQATLLPAGVILLGVVAAMFLRRPPHMHG
ncbi:MULTISPECIES: DHA2 family efflux MFS transporter permease subunit [unclassified Microbacterium]|uniref:DHA2 family efflux MFS transporter permease subunit n=1 Tax=Microbacterium sp. zg-B96 TaxID=3049069 RepID=UPI00214B1615|nr:MULTISPECIES: DHA2 family efflux MFS transporter permease subunit [unclassified Microbacterium]MCR2782967.1 DHA2 family efflux MFS transporter permease subunit [Microbacterium sp. zg.B96]WIM17680.1 DHA2 family efflux MFS transporter permease subunit [Microbacterium sp. zg-B96]